MPEPIRVRSADEIVDLDDGVAGAARIERHRAASAARGSQRDRFLPAHPDRSCDAARPARDPSAAARHYTAHTHVKKHHDGAYRENAQATHRFLEKLTQDLS
jgi:hypothetical protein